MTPGSYRVVATAGHVDHGKSTLVKALTGTDPDRLREEQERQMTIDLGFASLRLEDGTVVGIVDVPGHRDFIHNMLAGVGGIDMVILTVAADEGIMPQTREHIAILDLLQVRRGIVAITKSDLVDEEWLELVTEEVGEALSGTSLAEAPLLVVSAATGQGLPELVGELGRALATVPPAPDLGRPRLPVDRVFTLRGHGTIVTGTLVGGSLRVADQATLVPSGLKARIRSLQTHGAAIEQAQPGSRVAANLTGLQKDEVSRGEVLTTGQWLQPTTMADVWLRYLGSARRSLAHSDVVHFFSGTFDTMARVRLLQSDEMAPGEEGWAQVVFDKPVPLAHGDRFIVREASPSATVGGGLVVDAHPLRRHRRFDPAVAAWLQSLRDLPEEEQVLVRLARSGPVLLTLVARWLDAPVAQAAALLQRLAARGKVVELASGSPDSTVVAGADAWRRLSEAATAAVSAYHGEHPLRPGMPKEELRKALRLRQAIFAACVDRWLAEGALGVSGDRLRLPDWTVTLGGAEREQADRVLAKLRESGTAGMTMADLAATAGEELLQAMLAGGRAVRLPDDIVLAADVFAEATAAVQEALRQRGGMTVAEVRDLLGSNRRSTLALLGHLDDQGITRRQGDQRVPGRRFPGGAG